MRKWGTLIGLLLAFFTLKGQSELIGKYDTDNWSHSNRYHFEELCLREGNRFEYKLRMKFIDINLTGTWSVNKNQLILTSDNSKEGILESMETFSSEVPDGHTRFDVRDFGKERVNYSILAVSGDTAITIGSRYGVTDIPLHKVESYQVSTPAMTFPVKTVTSQQANFVTVLVNTKRVFDDEAWMILANGAIRPKRPDGKLTRYFLSKTAK
ncbi:MAG: hypothetical protein AAGA66_00020 [Bacteroidota bacterium]